ncbi:hypothetical protein [Undibacterium sp. WLX3042]|uniref:hypothetical protein n=1 Tax=Undibacterium sp. WLX3042 TaxID=3412686 RepID=UPI003C2C9F27
MSKKFIFLTLSSFIVCNLSLAADHQPGFIVTQSLNYKNKVDLSEFGVPYTPILYESSILPSVKSDQMVSDQELRTLLEQTPASKLPIVIDIERWPAKFGDVGGNKSSLAKATDVIQKLKSLKRDLKFGYYGVAPMQTYWPLVNPRQADQHQKWREYNELVKTDFAPFVDAIYPSLYTFYEDQNGWKTYAVETLRHARKFNKPVYCFLWPKYHESNRRLKDSYIPADYWRMELETCKANADGMVIWNYEPKKEWDPNADWWKETLKFLKTLNQ